MLVSLVLYLYNGDGQPGCPHRYLAAVSRLGAHGVPTVNQGGLTGNWFPRDLVAPPYAAAFASRTRPNWAAVSSPSFFRRSASGGARRRARPEKSSSAR